MTMRLVFTLGALAAACAALASNVAAADQIRLRALGGAFPERTWVLSLPTKQRLTASAVKVTETSSPARRVARHRQGVVHLAVAPAGPANGVESGTILAIDESDSMRGKPIDNAIVAARKFAERRNADQRLGILTFNSSTSTAVGLTVDQGAIDRALAQKPQLKPQTHLYDAIAQAIDQIRVEQLDVGSIVVVSDGADVGSSITLDQVIQRAKDADVGIFTVGLRSRMFRRPPLQRLADSTGGYFSPADSPSDLAQIYDKLGLQLAHQYILKYNSMVGHGRPVTVSVSVDGFGSTTAKYVTPTIAGPSTVVKPSALSGVWQSPLTMFAVALLVPALIAAAIIVSLRHRGSTVRARVSDYVSMPSQRRELDALVSRVFTGTEHSLERTRWWQHFKNALQFADVPYPPVQVVFATLVVTLFAAWLLALIAAPLALCAVTVPLILRGIIKGRIARKRRVFGDQLADNLDVLASGMRAGHSLVGALAVVVGDAPEPSKTEFHRVIADEQLGVPLDAALDRVAERMRNRDLEQVALVASVQSETGGNAAEVLDRVTDTIRERQELRRLVRTLTAQGRLARWIVSLLPVLLLIAIAVISPDYMHPMFTHTSGLVALTVGVFMIVTGSLVIGKLVDIEV
jgi:tight adherence protein B